MPAQPCQWVDKKWDFSWWYLSKYTSWAGIKEECVCEVNPYGSWSDLKHTNNERGLHERVRQKNDFQYTDCLKHFTKRCLSKWSVIMVRLLEAGIKKWMHRLHVLRVDICQGLRKAQTERNTDLVMVNSTGLLSAHESHGCAWITDMLMEVSLIYHESNNWTMQMSTRDALFRWENARNDAVFTVYNVYSE